ncbi:MAG: tRNA (guanosine(37)-N1)-methyltransferase TrmD [Phycisphaerales bacterium]|nr:tRNA (guanosine(37)-N1)-methyltransferase TrmD [Phycisphaerales bacterium]
MRIDILSTFPDLFSTALQGSVLATSIPARAASMGKVSYHPTDIRAHTLDKHRKTDDRPFGGGPGMVMTCQPLFDAVTAVEAADPRPARRILLTPQGTPLTQPLVESLAKEPRLLLIAGHYEGIDERVIDVLAPLEISIGDYVLSSGELAALVLIDAVVRLLPDVLGDQLSAVEDSFSIAKPHLGTSQTPRRERINLPPGQRLLDCPHYTKPREWMGKTVPDVLLSGDHEAVARWRLLQRLKRTRARRPDLLPPELRAEPNQDNQ